MCAYIFMLKLLIRNIFLIFSYLNGLWITVTYIQLLIQNNVSLHWWNLCEGIHNNLIHIQGFSLCWSNYTSWCFSDILNCLLFAVWWFIIPLSLSKVPGLNKKLHGHLTHYFLYVNDFQISLLDQILCLNYRNSIMRNYLISSLEISTKRPTMHKWIYAIHSVVFTKSSIP